tara:strand:- start:46 stop:498 length:453 start_codon:yes stop_codon:yes gene_type:complete
MRLRLLFTLLQKGIKMKHIILAITISVLTVSAANAQDREPVFFQSVTPCDILTGVGLYIKDVGCKTVTGTKKVIKGTGEIITSPFRSRLNWPRPRMFRFERGYWVPPKLKTLRPPKVEMGVPLEPKGNLIFPLHRELSDPNLVKIVGFSF